MAGIVPVFIFLDEASIYAFLDLPFDLVDLVLWGGVWTPSCHRPFKLWSEFEVHLDQFFARQVWGQRSKNLLIFLDELTEPGVQVYALQFFNKILLSMEVALPFFPVSSYAPWFQGVVRPPSPVDPSGHSEGSIPEVPRDQEESSLDHPPRTI